MNHREMIIDLEAKLGGPEKAREALRLGRTTYLAYRAGAIPPRKSQLCIELLHEKLTAHALTVTALREALELARYKFQDRVGFDTNADVYAERYGFKNMLEWRTTLAALEAGQQIRTI